MHKAWIASSRDAALCVANGEIAVFPLLEQLCNTKNNAWLSDVSFLIFLYFLNFYLLVMTNADTANIGWLYPPAGWTLNAITSWCSHPVIPRTTWQQVWEYSFPQWPVVAMESVTGHQCDRGLINIMTESFPMHVCVRRDSANMSAQGVMDQNVIIFLFQWNNSI